MYSDPQKKRKCCDNLIKKEMKKTQYIDNDVHAYTDPKLQNMSKIQLLRIIVREGLQKSTKGGFVEFQKTLISSILVKAIVTKKLYESINEGQYNKMEGKRGPQYSNNEKSHIIYEYDMLESFLLDSGGGHLNWHSRNKENITLK